MTGRLPTGVSGEKVRSAVTRSPLVVTSAATLRMESPTRMRVSARAMTVMVTRFDPREPFRACTRPVPTLTHRQWACRSANGYRHWPPADQ